MGDMYDEQKTFERKVAIQSRLERLSARLAEEGLHEAAELMLGENHLALGRCLLRWNQVKRSWLSKWKLKTSELKAREKRTMQALIHLKSAFE